MDKQTVSEDIEVVDVEYKNEIDVVTDENGKVSLSFLLPS